MPDPTPSSRDDVDDLAVRSRVPRATWAIITANVAVYLVMVARGDNGITTDAHRLVAAGGNFEPLVADGQWWRIITAAFLHGGLLHIALNMIALWSGGILLERTVGTVRFLAIYLASAVGAGLCSLLVGPAVVSVGASGAIFGVYGSLLGLALQHTRHRARWSTSAMMPPHIARRLVGEIAGLFIVNLLIGLMIPGIDVAAHVGGFASGIALSWIGAGAEWIAATSAVALAASVVFPLLPVSTQLASLDRACRARIGAACLGAGRLVERAPGKKDPTKALAYFDRGCEAGSSRSCLVAAQAQLTRGHAARAVQAFTRACDGSEPRGCNALAEMYETGRGVPRDDRRAAQLFGRACDSDNGFGCFRLGAMYRAGRGVPADVRRAAALESKACDRDEPRGCTLAAAALISGAGVKKDVTRGMALYRKACDANEPLACLAYGALLADGSGGIARDPALAAVVLTRACDLGAAPACARAGALVAADARMTNHLLRAAALFERGCALRDAASCFNAAEAYARGRGRTKDPARALTYYEQACQHGMKQICAFVSQLRAAPRRD